MLKLVKKAQKGNDKAFLKLFQTYEQDLYRIAFVYVKNQTDALDVVQETAYRSFKAIKSLSEPNYFKTWLIRIVISCSLDLLRKQKKVIQLKPELTEDLSTELNFDMDLKMTLNDLIEQLEENEKSVVILKYYYGLTFKEISETLDVPLGSAKTVLYRAVGKLRESMKGADFYE